MEKQEFINRLEQTRNAARDLALCSTGQVTEVLEALADRILDAEHEILTANEQDLARMPQEDPKYDRLLLNHQRLLDIANDLRNVAALPSPVGEVLEQRQLDNGLELSKVRVPMGVIGVIFESRPNVAFDVFALCFRTLNACVLKGSSDARDTNRVIVGLIQQVLTDHAVDPAVVYLTPPERQWLPVLLQATAYIDLAIPRGSQGLIDFVRDNARIPVIETGAGIVHTYVESSADIDMATAVITNAKTRRVSVCNALDTLVIDRELLPRLPELVRNMAGHDVTIYADDEAYPVLLGNYEGVLEQAREEHFGQEFLSYRMSIKTISGIKEALQHINRYSSRHSEAIVTEDQELAEQFLNQVDAAAVYVNASTAFTDGAQFGMGAEIGISTQKLHARGPMALPELTSYKWQIRGSGQIRPAG